MIYLTLLLIAAFAGTILTGWIYIRRLRAELKQIEGEQKILIRIHASANAEREVLEKERDGMNAQRKALKDINEEIDTEREHYRQSRDTWKSIAINHMALIKKIADTYYISGNCEVTGWRFRVNPEYLRNGVVQTRHPRKRDGRYEPIRYDV